jgi:2-polyprenyl-3-methyl-5-hydroxy-6-metoxy-1,4-benzoquinol methylase
MQIVAQPAAHWAVLQWENYLHPTTASAAGRLNLTSKEVSAAAAHLYRQGPAGWALLQRLRPFICPFDELLDLVPPESRVLDVGCGAGLFMLLLARFNRIASGEGFDVSQSAVAAAQRAADSGSLRVKPNFSVRAIEEGIPHGDWSCIAIVDVLHHVPPRFQEGFLNEVARALPAGGRLLIKDMVARPRWRSAANRVHDLVMARQWVHHLDPDAVERMMTQAGLRCTHRSHKNLWWYGHWTRLFERQ